MALIIIVVAVVLVDIVVTIVVLTRLMMVCPPNKLLVLSGRATRLSDGTVVGYRLIRAGRVLRIPFVEQAHWMDLSGMRLDQTMTKVYTVSGEVELKVSASARIDSSKPAVHRAVERFLDTDREQIRKVAQETLEGALRNAAVKMTVDELRQDAVALANALREGGEFEKLGLVVDSVSVKNVEVTKAAKADRPAFAEASHDEEEGAQDLPPEVPAQEAVPHGEDVSAVLRKLTDGAASSSERALLVKELVGKLISLEVQVEDVTFTTEAELPQTHKGGRTVVGKAMGSVAVAVCFPKERSEELAGHKRGSRIHVEAEVVRWDSLFHRLVAAAR